MHNSQRPLRSLPTSSANIPYTPGASSEPLSPAKKSTPESANREQLLATPSPLRRTAPPPLTPLTALLSRSPLRLSGPLLLGRQITPPLSSPRSTATTAHNLTSWILGSDKNDLDYLENLLPLDFQLIWQELTPAALKQVKEAFLTFFKNFLLKDSYQNKINDQDLKQVFLGLKNLLPAFEDLPKVLVLIGCLLQQAEGYGFKGTLKNFAVLCSQLALLKKEYPILLEDEERLQKILAEFQQSLRQMTTLPAKKPLLLEIICETMWQNFAVVVRAFADDLLQVYPVPTTEKITKIGYLLQHIWQTPVPEQNKAQENAFKQLFKHLDILTNEVLKPSIYLQKSLPFDHLLPKFFGILATTQTFSEQQELNEIRYALIPFCDPNKLFIYQRKNQLYGLEKNKKIILNNIYQQKLPPSLQRSKILERLENFTPNIFQLLPKEELTNLAEHSLLLIDFATAAKFLTTWNLNALVNINRLKELQQLFITHLDKYLLTMSQIPLHEREECTQSLLLLFLLGQKHTDYLQLRTIASHHLEHLLCSMWRIHHTSYAPGGERPQPEITKKLSYLDKKALFPLIPYKLRLLLLCHLTTTEKELLEQQELNAEREEPIVLLDIFQEATNTQNLTNSVVTLNPAELADLAKILVFLPFNLETKEWQLPVKLTSESNNLNLDALPNFYRLFLKHKLSFTLYEEPLFSGNYYLNLPRAEIENLWHTEAFQSYFQALKQLFLRPLNPTILKSLPPPRHLGIIAAEATLELNEELNIRLDNGTIRKVFFNGYYNNPRLLIATDSQTGTSISLQATQIIGPRQIPKPLGLTMGNSGKIHRLPRRLYNAILQKLNENLSPNNSLTPGNSVAPARFNERLNELGYETLLTTSGLAYCLYLLALNPQLSQRELQNHLGTCEILTPAPAHVIEQVAKSLQLAINNGYLLPAFLPTDVHQSSFKVGVEPQSWLIRCLRASLPLKTLIISPLCGRSLYFESLNRQFSSDALFVDLYNQVILDPLGSGLDDAQRHYLRDITSKAANAYTFLAPELIFAYCQRLNLETPTGMELLLKKPEPTTDPTTANYLTYIIEHLTPEEIAVAAKREMQLLQINSFESKISWLITIDKALSKSTLPSIIQQRLKNILHFHPLLQLPSSYTLANALPLTSIYQSSFANLPR